MTIGCGIFLDWARRSGGGGGGDIQPFSQTDALLSSYAAVISLVQNKAGIFFTTVEPNAAFQTEDGRAFANGDGDTVAALFDPQNFSGYSVDFAQQLLVDYAPAPGDWGNESGLTPTVDGDALDLVGDTVTPSPSIEATLSGSAIGHQLILMSFTNNAGSSVTVTLNATTSGTEELISFAVGAGQTVEKQVKGYFLSTAALEIVLSDASADVTMNSMKINSYNAYYAVAPTIGQAPTRRVDANGYPYLEAGIGDSLIYNNNFERPNSTIITVTRSGVDVQTGVTYTTGDKEILVDGLIAYGVFYNGLSEGEMDTFTAWSDQIWPGGGGTPPDDLVALTDFIGSAGGMFYHPAAAGGAFAEIISPTTPSSVDGPVGTLADLSGNALPAVAYDNAQRPTLRDDGNIYIEHDAVDDAMYAPVFDMGVTGTFYFATENGVYVRQGMTVSGFEEFRLPRQKLLGAGFVPRYLSGIESFQIASLYKQYPLSIPFFATVRGSTSVALIAATSSAVDYTVRWGDGTTETFTSGATASHTYASPYYGEVVVSGGTITSLSLVIGAWDLNTSQCPLTPISTFSVTGTNEMVGDWNDLPNSIQELTVTGNNGISGQMENAPTSLTTLAVSGFNTMDGDLGDLPGGVIYIALTGLNGVTMSTTTPWRTATMAYVRIHGTLSQTDVDNLLIALANVVSWVGAKTIDLNGGTNASRSSASDAAVSTLTGAGVTVLTA